MNDPLDDVTFLTRSPHRVSLLEALREGPQSRQSLTAATGASRVTVGRILSDMTERGWVRRDGPTYELTATGEPVIDGLVDLRETVAAAQHLRAVADWLPTDWLTFDIGLLADAEVVTPTPGDPLAPAREAANLMREADHVAVLAEAVTSETVAMQWAAATERGQESRVVMTRQTTGAIGRDPTMAEQFRDLLRSGSLEAARYDGTVPLSLGVYDHERVGFGLLDGMNRPAAVLVTDHPTVRSWAMDCIEEHFAESEPLEPAHFDPA